MHQKDRQTVLATLIGEGLYRSPEIPTKRFGGKKGVAITDSMYRETEEEHQFIEPYQWYVIDLMNGDICAYAQTKVVTLVDNNWRTTGEKLFREVPKLHPTESRKALDGVWPSVANSFWSDGETGRDDRIKVDMALRSIIPAGLQPWLLCCCADFWTWLARE